MALLQWPARSWLRLALVAGLLAAFAASIDRSPGLAAMFAPLTEGLARIVTHLLTWLGQSPQRDLATVAHSSGFAYQIDFACTGIVLASLLGAAIVATPAPRWARLIGLAIAIPFVLLLNLIRLVSLFWIGVHYPQIFPWAHSPVGEFLMLASAVAFLLGWMRRTNRPQRRPLSATLNP